MRNVRWPNIANSGPQPRRTGSRVLAGTVPTDAGASVEGVVLTTTPTLPAGKVNLSVSGVALTTTPTQPAGSVTLKVTGVAFTVTPTQPVGDVSEQAGSQTVTGIVLSTAPSLPAGQVNHKLTGIALSTTPTQPAGQINLNVAGAVLSVTPTLPAGDAQQAGAVASTAVIKAQTPVGAPVRRFASSSLVTGFVPSSDLGGAALTVTPTLPAGQVNLSITAVALSTTPTLPAGSARVASIAGVVLTVTPTLPSGDVQVAGVAAPETRVIRAKTPATVRPRRSVASRTVFGLVEEGDQALNGVALEVTPELPQASLRVIAIWLSSYQADISYSPKTKRLPSRTVLPLGLDTEAVTGVALSVVPSLPAGQIQQSALTGVALTVTPSLPAASLVTDVTGQVLVILPVLPAGIAQTAIFLTGVVLTIEPVLAGGRVSRDHGLIDEDTHNRFNRPVGTTIVRKPSLRVGDRFTRRP